MRELKFRAVISPRTTIYFTLQELIDPTPRFAIRALLIPWLRQGNKPDRFTETEDCNGQDLYEGDILEREHKIYDYIIFSEGCFCLARAMMCYELTYGVGQAKIIGNIHEHSELLEQPAKEEVGEQKE